MNGTIIQVFGRYYTVRGEGHEVNAVLRGRIKLDDSAADFSAPAVVGDVVDFELNDQGGEGVINTVLPRRNYFSRQGRVMAKTDIIAANLDLILVVQSYARPQLNLRYVDRLMVRAMEQQIPVTVCVNKEDLVGEKEKAYVQTYYNGTGFSVFSLVAEQGIGIEPVARHIEGKRVLFVGSSGVGKTTLLNRLFPDVSFKTSHVSESSGKGRHTTTNVKMVTGGRGTEIIDTPGMREFGLADIEVNMLSHYFPDFALIQDQCKFQPCYHDHEPHCAVLQSVEEGNIHPDRHRSYLNILESLRHEWQTRYRSS